MDHMPWMLDGKLKVREYLEELNKEKKVSILLLIRCLALTCKLMVALLP